MSRGNALAPNRGNSVPRTVRTSRQRSCNQRVGWDIEPLDLLNVLALGCYHSHPDVIIVQKKCKKREKGKKKEEKYKTANYDALLTGWLT